MGYAIPQPKPKSSAGWAVGLVVALIAGGVTWFLLNRGLGFPDEIAGHPMNDSDIAQAVVESTEAGASSVGVDFKVAAYGTDAEPAFMVMVVEDAFPAFDTFFQGAATGAGQGAAIDSADIVHQDRGSTSYACVPIGSAPPMSTLCGWSDEETTGLVISFVRQDLTASFVLTEQIRDAIEG
ncbi:MAG TPA: hypothetical protein VJN50_00300 [Actinomycetota bacterium]|nr:hypothetical protein [Actinomycetota bacterium]